MMLATRTVCTRRERCLNGGDDRHDQGRGLAGMLVGHEAQLPGALPVGYESRCSEGGKAHASAIFHKMTCKRFKMWKGQANSPF